MELLHIRGDNIAHEERKSVKRERSVKRDRSGKKEEFSAKQRLISHGRGDIQSTHTFLVDAVVGVVVPPSVLIMTNVVCVVVVLVRLNHFLRWIEWHEIQIVLWYSWTTPYTLFDNLGALPPL